MKQIFALCLLTFFAILIHAPESGFDRSGEGFTPPSPKVVRTDTMNGHIENWTPAALSTASSPKIASL